MADPALSRSTALPNLTIAVLTLFGIAGLIFGALSVVVAINAIPNSTDIDAFTVAGRLIVEGRGALIHDPAINLEELQKFSTASRPIIWNYPPHASLATAAIFGYLPPFMARALVSLATMLAAAWLAQSLIPPSLPLRQRLPLMLVLVASAPMFLAFTAGQPAFLISIAIFLAALHACRDHWLAILLVPVAAMKPHIGGPMLLAVFLAQPQSRRTLFYGGLLTIALTMLSEAVIGWGATMRFIEAIRSASATVAASAHYPTDRLVTTMAEAAVLFKSAPQLGKLLAVMISASVLGVVLVALWRARRDDSFAIIALASMVPLWSTPYLYDYDFGLQFACLIALVVHRRARGPADPVANWLLAGACLAVLPVLLAVANKTLELDFKHSIGLLASAALTMAALRGWEPAPAESQPRAMPGPAE